MTISRFLLLAVILVAGNVGVAHAYLPDEEEQAVYAGQKAFYSSLLGGTGSEDELLAALDSADPVHRAAATFLLTDLQGEEAIPELRRRLADASQVVRGEAITALTRLHAPAGLAAALEDIEHPDPTLRLIAVRGVGRYRNRREDAADVERALRRALEDEQAAIRSLAAVELVRAAGPGSAPALRHALEQEKDPAVRSVLELQLEALAAPDASQESPR